MLAEHTGFFGFAGGLGLFAKTVVLHRLIDAVRQRTGVQRCQQVVAGVVVRVVAGEPVKLLGQGVRGQAPTWLDQRGKSADPLLRLRRVVTERRRQIGIAVQHQRQQAAALVLLLEKLVHVERSGVADHIARKIIAQAVTAHHRQRRQCLRRGVKLGAFGVGMNRLERVRDRLNLVSTPGGVFEPGGGDELLMEFGALGIVGVELVELALQAFRQET